jgi:hypothetical protein
MLNVNGIRAFPSIAGSLHNPFHIIDPACFRALTVGGACGQPDTLTVVLPP